MMSCQIDDTDMSEQRCAECNRVLTSEELASGRPRCQKCYNFYCDN